MKTLWLLALATGLLLPRAADAADLPRGVERAITVDRFTMKGDKGVKWAAKGIAGARKDVLAELFAVSDKDVVNAMHGRIQKGVPVRANVDPENIRHPEIRGLIAAGAAFRSWGGNAIKDDKYKIKLNPRKVHAKAAFFDENGWLSTASLLRKHGGQSLDATALVSGESAAAARAITEHAYNEDLPGMRVAAAEAVKHGVLLNDGAADIHHLTDGMHDLLMNAEHELVISMKIIQSPVVAKAISEAAERGVKVTLFTHPSKMSDNAREALSPKIRVAGDPFGILHANIIIADQKVAIFGSAHGTNRALAFGSRRKSHEMGYVVDNPKAIGKMRAAILKAADGEAN